MVENQYSQVHVNPARRAAPGTDVARLEVIGEEFGGVTADEGATEDLDVIHRPPVFPGGVEVVKADFHICLIDGLRR